MPVVINSLIAAVPKLTSNNYQDWKFAVSMVMRRAKCLSVADGTDEKGGTREKTTEWEAASEQALTIIGLTITPDQYQYIRTAKTGPEAWTALKNVYEKPSRANRIALKREFYTTIHDPTAPIRDYTNRITELANRLSAIGVTLQDTDIVDVLIFNLHSSWSSLAATLAAAQGELKISDVIGALVDEEGRRGAPNPDDTGEDTALMSRSRRMRSPEQKFRNNTDGCYVCGHHGHIARDCHKRAQPGNANVATEQTETTSPPNNFFGGTVW